MPIYEYQCSACGHTFEKIQRFSDRPLRKCPECQGRVEKLISRTAFVLKGGGWYSDGYSGRGSKGKSSSDSSSASSSAPASSDSKSTKKSKGGGGSSSGAD